MKKIIISFIVAYVSSAAFVTGTSNIILPFSQNGGPMSFGEFSLNGTLVRSLGTFPDGTRDVVQDASGNLQAYTGTFTPALMSQHNGSWTSQTFPGWSTVNSLDYGGIASIGNYVFVTDMLTYNGGEQKGIIRFSTMGGSAVRFATSIEPIDLTTDGTHIWALVNPREAQDNVAYEFDADTFALIKTVPIPGFDTRSISVASNGDIYSADWHGVINHLNSDGTLIKSISFDNGKFSDINLSANGDIALARGFGGGIYYTDTNLVSLTQFQAQDGVTFPTEFTAFSVEPVPEPTSVALACIGAIVLCGTQKARRP